MDYIQDWSQAQASAEYIELKKVQLAKSADDAKWEPSDYIRKVVKNIDSIKVELMDENTDLNRVDQALCYQGELGLVLLGPSIGRNSHPYLIIITTNTVYYAIDPEGPKKLLGYLWMKLNDKKLKFYLSNGLNESDYFYHRIGDYIKSNQFDLANTNASCCSGLDISLMESMKNKPDSALTMYPEIAVKRSKRASPLIEKFENLIETWLYISKEDISFNADQLEHLKERDSNNNFNLTAINVIKKRCSLVLPLANALEYYNWIEISIMSDNSFKSITTGNQEVKRQMKNCMKAAKRLGKVDAIFFTHYHS